MPIDFAKYGGTNPSEKEKKKSKISVDFSKYDDSSGKKQAESFKQAEQKFGQVSVNPSQSPVMRQANKYAADNPTKPTWNGVIDNPIGRTAVKGLNVVGKVYDKVSHLPVVNQVTGAMQGAIEPFVHNNDPENKDPLWKRYLGNVVDTVNIAQKITNPASLLTGNLISSSKDKNIIEKGKAALQAPKSMIQGAFNPDEARKKLEDSLKSKSLVTNLAVGSLADPLSYVPVPSIKGIKGISESFERMFGRVKPIESASIEQAGTILGLPEPKSVIMAREAQNRSVLPANTDVIHAQGNVPTPETLGLPQGQYTAPARMKVNNHTETLDYVMTKIKPQVMSIIEAPTRRDLLIQYVQKNTQIPVDEIHNMKMTALQDLGQNIQKDLHSNMQQIAFDVAKQQGHDLPALLEGQAPSLRAQLAKDTQSQVYGVQPPKIGIQKPEFNVTHNADAAMPITKVGRPSSLREVAATTEVKPKIEPIKGTVTKKEAVKPKDEVVGISDTLKPRLEPISGNREVISAVKQSEKVVGERGFAQTLKASEKTPEEFKNALDSKYTAITNEDTVKAANKRVSKDIEGAASYVMGKSAPSAEKVATAARLIDEFNKSGNIERAVDIASKVSEELTKAGQTVQAAKLFNMLTPEGRLRSLVRHAEENGKVVTPEHATKYMSLAKEMKDSGLSGQRSTEVMDIFDKVKKGEKVTPEDQATLDELIKDVKSYVKSKEVKVPKEANLSPKLKEKKIRDQVLDVLNEQETKVLERMRARGNRLSSLPLDVYADYALLGSIKLAKGAVSFSKWSEQMIKDAGEAIKPHLAPIYEKSQRLLESTANKITDVKISSAEKVAEKFIKEGGISLKDEQLLRDLAKKVSEFSSDAGRNADMKMQQILNSYQKSDMGAKIATLRYIDMLLNTGTQAVNAISGPIMMTYSHMLDIISTPVDIVWSKVMKVDRSTTFKHGPSSFDGMFNTVKDFFKGGKIGGKSGWQGVDPEGIATQHDIRGLTFPGKYNPLGWAERTLGTVSKAPDFATYYATKMGELRKQAYLDAINKGIKDKQNIRNYMDKYLTNPPTQALEQASRMGKKVTFQYTEGFAGKAARTARKVNELTGSKDLGVANAVVPFVRTPLNIAITGVENTPAGLIKGLYEINRLRNGAENITKREIIKTLVSSTAGGSVILGGLGYILSDLGIVTGDYSSSSGDVQSLEEEIGSGKFRFNTTAFGRMFKALIDGDVDNLKEVSQYKDGDKQFDYNKLQPLAFPFAAGATFSDQRELAQLAKLRGAEYPMSKQIAESGLSSLSSLFGMSSLQGLTNTFKTKPGAKGAEIPIQILQNIGEAFLKGFSPSALAQEARRQDPKQRQTSYNQSIGEDVGSYFKSRIPGQSQSLQPSITNLGDTKLNAPGITGQYVNPMKSQQTQYNEAAQVIYDLITRTGNEKLAPTAMEKSVEGKNKQGIKVTIKLTPGRYSQLQEDVGKQIAEKILSMPKYDSDQKTADKVEEIYQKIRDKERNKVKKELGLRISK